MNGKVTDTNTIPFSIIVAFLEKVASARGQIKKDLFRQFMERLDRGKEYPALRLIFPESDSSRGAYGLKEHTIGRLFSDILMLPSYEKDRVLKWKDPSLQAKHNCTPGDFPSVLLSAIEPRMSSVRSESLTVGDVNALLDSIYVESLPENRKNLFQDMIYRASPRQIKWIMRIILKDMKLGIGVEAILRHLHPDAVQLFHMSSSLKHVLEAICAPKEAVATENAGNQIATIYFQPFKPMLSERVNPGAIPERFTHVSDSIYLEPKLDGERMMIHVNKRSGTVAIFSRNGVNFTKKYGDHQLSPLMLKAFKGLGAVFDGELVTWDPLRKVINAFGSNREVSKSAASSISDTPESNLSQDLLGVADNGNLFYVIFDLVYYVDSENGEYDLRNTELHSRRELLDRILLPVEHRVEAIQCKYIKAPTVDDIKEYLKNALDRKMEGIIIKRANSLYKLNIRGRGWYKVKADYDNTFADTLDLVILGGYFSETSSDIGHDLNPIDAVTSFLVGVPRTNDEGTEFLTVTKVSTGLTKTQLLFLRNQLKQAMVSVEPGTLPKWLGKWKPSKPDRPDVFFNPLLRESSIVLEVNAGEILHSAAFSSGYQLRFPRIVRIRADKFWPDATSFDDIREMASVDRDNDRVFIQNLSRFEKGHQQPPSPRETKKRKKEIVIIKPFAHSQSESPRHDNTQMTVEQVSGDEW